MKGSFSVIKKLAALTICLFSSLEASTSPAVFAKYPNKYFIESGSYRGDGICMALNTGFEVVYSIELSPFYYEHCLSRFGEHPQVGLFEGDSSIMLLEVLKNVDAPATFWLDGHYSGDNTACGSSYSPILAELDAIGQHQIKTHTILIDDIRLLGGLYFDFVSLDTIIKKILEINPNYRISYEDGHIANDVLVAKVFGPY